MGEIETGLEQALRTRDIPVTHAARVRFLLKTAKGSTKALAARLGVSQRTVQRWLKGERRQPRPSVAARIEAELRRSWQPRVRARIRRSAERYGFTLHTRAQFGFASAAGTTDDPACG